NGAINRAENPGRTCHLADLLKRLTDFSRVACEVLQHAHLRVEGKDCKDGFRSHQFDEIFGGLALALNLFRLDAARSVYRNDYCERARHRSLFAYVEELKLLWLIVFI